MTDTLPSLVIVGRPNVGKSTLFNRLTGTRRSIVTDEPGITRDRIYGRALWRGKPFEVVDTGGMIPEDKAAIPREILRQADVAIAGATKLMVVVDARAGVTPLDAELVRRLRRTGKPLIIAANKVDTHASQVLASEFYELGTDVFPVSAEHGTGIDDLLDAVTQDFPETPDALDASNESDGDEKPDPRAWESAEIQVAIIGRPNVGKSTLLNALAGAERSIVSPVPGTTRDAVDTDVIRGAQNYRFIDTAGIRRKGKTTQLAEKLSVIMARKHLERADVALMICDASAGISAGDATIAGYAHESGRSVIIVMNKWDLAIEKAKEAAEKEKKSPTGRESFGARSSGNIPSKLRRKPPATDSAHLMAEYEPLVRERLKFLNYAPVVFISALTGAKVDELYGWIDKVIRARRRRISTGELNRWLKSVDLDRGTSPSAHRVKIYYITQAASSPPTFILFTNQKDRLHFGYERFLENRLRAEFDFLGSPIRFLQRVRERGERSRERALAGPAPKHKSLYKHKPKHKR
jgi:GTP-binding protein